MFLLVNVIVIILRFKRPNEDRPFRISGGIGRLPILPVLGVAATVLMASQLEITSIALASGLTAIGPVLFVVVRMRHGKQRTKQEHQSEKRSEDDAERKARQEG
jgi:APA family basic amino acid/polyamine antiporter